MPAFAREVGASDLFLTRDDLDRPGMEGAKYICSPPLRDTATQYGSPFSEHLYHLYALLDQDLALKQAVIRVIRDGRCDDQHALFRLQKAGVLVTVSADLYRCRCGLYHRYLQGALR